MDWHGIGFGLGVWTGAGTGYELALAWEIMELEWELEGIRPVGYNRLYFIISRIYARSWGGSRSRGKDGAEAVVEYNARFTAREKYFESGFGCREVFGKRI
jgi:hypothetical protein